MPVTNNLNAFLGAAMLGVISAAGMFLVEHYRQERRRYEMAKDMARIDRELTMVKKDLQDLMNKKKERSLKTRKSRKANSIISSSTNDEYLSASGMDSSDLEFYDVSEDELDVSVSNSTSTLVNMDAIQGDVDRKSNEENLDEISASLIKLQDLCLEHPGNPELLWRIGKCHYKLMENSEDKEYNIEHLKKGLDACNKAIELAPENGDAYKWAAILIGARADYGSMKERIEDSHLFKLHVDKALYYLPNDSTLHHMLGRFCYEITGLKWYERKVASTLFATPPTSTYEEALEHFMQCEQLANYDWKANKLFIAKCKIAQGEYKEAVAWLDKAKACKQGDCMDDKTDKEVNSLLAKYNSYR